MNPLLQAALSSIFRWALTFAAGFFVEKGIWSNDDASTYIGAASVALVTLVWSLWAKYRSRLKLVTAMASPERVSEQQVREMVADGMAPSTTLGRHEVPSLTDPKEAP